MKKFARSQATGNLGIGFVIMEISKHGSIFMPVHGESDIGIDGLIHIVENEIPSGILVALQIKAGTSYLVGDNFVYTATQDDLNYWNTLPLPVAIVFFDPESRFSAWLDVREYIHNNPVALINRRTKLSVNIRKHSFNTENLDAFITNFKIYEKKVEDLYKYLDCLTSDTHEVYLRGLSTLISNKISRFSKVLCLLLSRSLFHEDSVIRTTSIDTLSRYLNHPEDGFVPPDEFRNYVLTLISNLGEEEIKALLESAWREDSLEVDRGLIGQSIGVIIINIPRHQDHR